VLLDPDLLLEGHDTQVEGDRFLAAESRVRRVQVREVIMAKKPIKQEGVDAQDAAFAAFRALTEAIAKQSAGLIGAHDMFEGALHVMAMALAFQTDETFEECLEAIDQHLDDLVAHYRNSNLPKPVSEH
jgi:hypothetical protein